MEVEESGSDPAPCCLCGIQEDDQLRFGQLFKLGDLSVHHFCMLFSPKLAQKGKDDEGAEGFLAADVKIEMARSKSTICCFCGKGGATGLCMSMKCKRHYHVGCCVQANGLLQFFGQFKSFCVDHRPRQSVVGREAAESCGICLERTDPEDDHHVLWTPCCRHFFHRPCLQRMAYHFGYFFYCPGCRNKDNVSGFLKHMRHFGIFIPKRDASWEMVPNAFGELLERHLMCDVRYCLCNQGRSHQETDIESPWRLFVCGTCGSAGSHAACSSLPDDATGWVCRSCTLEPAPVEKATLKDFLENRAASAALQGGEGSSRAPQVAGNLSLDEVLEQLDEPEKLIKFTVNPLSGLSVQTRPVNSDRMAAREPGRRPVSFSPEQLLPEVVVSEEDAAEADLRLWSQNHVAAAEAGGTCCYNPAHRRAPAAGPRRRARRSAAPCRWAARASASNAAPRPPADLALQQSELSGLPNPAELRDALCTLQCPGCRADFRLLSELTYHYQNHSGEALFYCRICQAATKQWGSFHVLDHHPDLRAEEWASYVDSSFQRAQAIMVQLLLNRKGIKVTVDQSQCIIRNIRAILAWRGEAPSRRVTSTTVGPASESRPEAPDDRPPKEFVCPQCDSVLRTQGMMTAHAFFHSAEAKKKYADRQYRCSSCFFGSGFAYLVTRHRTTHHRRAEEAPTGTGDGPPKLEPQSRLPSTSPEKKEEGETTAGVMDKASRPVANANGIYECPHCNSTTAIQSVMTKHLYLHTLMSKRKTENLRYHCLHCFFGSNQTQRVWKHLQQVHDETSKNIRKVCGKCGNADYNMQRHKCWKRTNMEGIPVSTTSAVRLFNKPKAVVVTKKRVYLRPPSAWSQKFAAWRQEAAKTGRCPVCSRRGSYDVLRQHIHCHTKEKERKGRAYPQHCPLCFFYAKHIKFVIRHLNIVHGKDHTSFLTKCGECNVATCNAKRHAKYHHLQRGETMDEKQDTESEQENPAETRSDQIATETVTQTATETEVTTEGNERQAVQSGSQTTVEPGCLGGFGDDHRRLDCPFCDGFFDSRRAYERHMGLVHSVGEESGARSTVCRFRFCTAEGSNIHYRLYHKGSADRVFRCSQCDTTFTRRDDLQTHTARHHADESMPAFQLRADGHCWCSNLPNRGTLTRNKHHLISGHSVLIRGYPGPRATPYSCPVCPAQLGYEALIQHMAGAHGWVFKTSGEEYKGSANPRSMEVGCPLCHKTFSFDKLFLHMQDKHQWIYSPSKERQKDKPSGKPRPVVVSKANQLVKRAVGKKIGNKVHGVAARVKLTISSTTPAKTDLYECPFCDAFFPSIVGYTAHTRRSHSGLITDKAQTPCPVKYCYAAIRGGHDITYHKDISRRSYPCDKCEFRSFKQYLVEKHQQTMHKHVRTPVRVLGVLCRCAQSAPTVSLPHLWAYHMEAARGPVGPRPQPYTCPECAASFEFYELVRHLKHEHRWKLKETGNCVFRESAQDAKGATGTVSNLTMNQTMVEPESEGDEDADEKEQNIDEKNMKVMRLKELVDHPDRYDCPFCDAFFLVKFVYSNHVKQHHSGLSPSLGASRCNIKYCYAACYGSTKHAARVHKGAKFLRFKCKHCDRRFKRNGQMKYHVAKCHGARTNPSMRLYGVSDCSCNSRELALKPSQHVQWNHSIQVRSYPGPRARPYSCPECFELLSFQDLIDHLSEKHGWRLKTAGEEAFGAHRVDNRNFESGSVSEDVLQNVSGQTPAPSSQEMSVEKMFGTVKTTVTWCPSGKERPSGSGTQRISPASNLAIAEKKDGALSREIFGCPLCDGFFLSAATYKEHAEAVHSGFSKPENICPVAYCYAQTCPGHKAMYHKHTMKKFECKSCDAVFSANSLLTRHIERAHRFKVNRANSRKLKSVCSCSMSMVKNSHLMYCHTVSLRGRPGPRSKAYLCPGKHCNLRMQFEDLLDHLVKVHQWRLKKKGQRAFPQLTPKPTAPPTPKSSDASTASIKSNEGKCHSPAKVFPPPPVLARPIEHQPYTKKTTYTCSYCNSFTGRKDEIARHRQSEHTEAYDAFLRFAATCVNTKGIYSCPFCLKKNKTTYLFRRHMSRSPDCRHRLGPEAVCWLEDPVRLEILQKKRRMYSANARAKKLADRMTQDIVGECETGEGPSPSGVNHPRAASVKAKLLLSEGEAAAVEKPSTGLSMTFSCHFCDFSGRKSEVWRHREQAHGEAYRVFLRFAESCEKKRVADEKKRYQCPFCPWNRTNMWELRVHVSSSAACRGSLEPLNLSWVENLPGETQDEFLSSAPKAVTTEGTRPLLVQRKATSVSAHDKTKVMPQKQKIFTCHYCSFSSDKSVVQQHQRLVHAKAHKDFLAFAVRNKTDGKYSCPHCRFSIIGLWRFKRHMYESSRCAHELGPETSWLNTGMTVRTEYAESPSEALQVETHLDARDDDGIDATNDILDMPIEGVLKREPLEIPADEPYYRTSSEEFILPDVETDENESFQSGIAGTADLGDEDRDETNVPREEEAVIPVDDGTPCQEPDSTADRAPGPESRSPTAAQSAADSPAPASPADQGIDPSAGNFECIKCSAKFAEKELLIEHSQTKHGPNRKKRSLSPDRSQPRIDMFFKRVKVEPSD